MKTKFIEAGNGFNWGKFAVCEFTPEEWMVRSTVDEQPLLRGRGWGRDHLLVLDLQTGEGAVFRIGGYAPADLNKRRIWVCPLFEPFLTWLYQVDGNPHTPGWLEALPDRVELPEAEPALYGYRRPGKEAIRAEKLKALVERVIEHADWEPGDVQRAVFELRDEYQTLYKDDDD